MDRLTDGVKQSLKVGSGKGERKWGVGGRGTEGVV